MQEHPFHLKKGQKGRPIEKNNDVHEHQSHSNNAKELS